MGKKKSPKSIPRTQQDVDRAFDTGKMAGVEYCLLLTLYTLRNRFSADDAQLKEFEDAFRYVIDSINRGYVTEADLRQVLKTEYETEIRIE